MAKRKSKPVLMVKALKALSFRDESRAQAGEILEEGRFNSRDDINLLVELGAVELVEDVADPIEEDGSDG